MDCIMMTLCLQILTPVTTSLAMQNMPLEDSLLMHCQPGWMISWALAGSLHQTESVICHT